MDVVTAGSWAFDQNPPTKERFRWGHLIGWNPNQAVGPSETPVGVEPNLESATTADGDCGCANCPGCCAANALQDGPLIVLPWHPLTPICNASSEHGTNCQSISGRQFWPSSGSLNRQLTPTCRRMSLVQARRYAVVPVDSQTQNPLKGDSLKAIDCDSL